MLKLFAAVALGLSSVVGLAHEEEPVGRISTEGIEVQWNDHTLVGTIDGKPLFADSLSSEFGTNIVLRLEGKTSQTVLRRVDGKVQAKLISTLAEGVRETALIVSSIDAQNGLIKGSIDGDTFVARITADEMAGNEYVSPTFTIEVAGKTYQFKMNGGHACIGCATKIVSTVLTAKRHLRAW